MSYTEKLGYLKGLIAGLGVDPNTESGKIYAAVTDVLTELADAVSDLEDNAAAVDAELDGITEELADVEDVLFDDEDDEEEGCLCGCEDVYEVVCPSCGEQIPLDEEMLEKGGIKCPACGEELEFCDCDDEDGE